MNYLWLIAIGVGTFDAQAQTVTGVKVSVTADSAATAREKALDQAHDLAFQKLLKENFSEVATPLPSHDTVMNMVRDFSIDREKTTPTSYTASLTFQFDAPQVQAWMQKQDQPSFPTLHSTQHSSKNQKTLKIESSYKTLSEWQDIKKKLEGSPEVQKVVVLAFSPQSAHLDVILGGDIEKLQQDLLLKGWLLSSGKEGWKISSKKPLGQ